MSPSSEPSGFLSFDTDTGRPVDLRLTGRYTLHVRGEAREQVLSYDKVRLILAVLALARGAPVERRQLARMLWPVDDVTTGRARLRHALHILRGAFHTVPQALGITASRVALDTNLVAVDVLRIAGYETGLDDESRLQAYGGPLLDGVNLPEGEAIQAWIEEWRARLDIELAQCRARLAEHYLRSGRLSEALDQVKRWVVLWPDDELCHRHLIRLLLQLNQRDAAVRAFEHCVSVLAQSTGGPPGAETRALLGLANQAVDSGAAFHRQPERRAHLPLAVLALAVTWEAGPQDELEDTLGHLGNDRRRIAECLVSHGAWTPQLGDITLQAYFGYPAAFERPVRQAVALARGLMGLELHPQTRMGLGLHADIALAESGSRSDAGGLLSQTAVALAWKAGHREVAISPATAARLEENEYVSFRRQGLRVHALRARPLAASPQRMHGRSNEFDSLVQQWARLSPGRPPTGILLCGPAGIGKSLLAQALADYADKTGGLAIRLECEESRREVPWRPLTRWLREVLASRLGGWQDEVTEAGMPPAAPARQHLQQHLGVPAHAAQELWNMVHTGSRLPHLNNHVTPALLEAATAALTSQANARRPLLIVVENLHWADPATSALIQHLGERRSGAPLMLLATCREPTTAPWATRQLQLAPLSRTSITELVAHRARQLRIPRELRTHVVNHSLGIPLYAHAMLRQAASGQAFEHIPQVIDLICLKFSQVGAEARQAALAIALLDRSLNTRQVQAILGLARVRAEHIVQQLVKTGLVMEEAQGLQCPLLVRNAVLRITSKDERRQIHEHLTRHLLDSMAAVPLVTADEGAAAARGDGR